MHELRMDNTCVKVHGMDWVGWIDWDGWIRLELGCTDRSMNWDGWQLPVMSAVVLLAGGLDALVGTAVNVETVDNRNISGIKRGKSWCVEININI